MEIASKLRKLDAYPKINEDFYSRTLSGGLITLASALVALFLFFSEMKACGNDLSGFDLKLKAPTRMRAAVVLSCERAYREVEHKIIENGNVAENTMWKVEEADGTVMQLASGLFLYSATETKLVVDTSRGETLRVNFDVTFPSLACSLVSVDTMDVSGEQHYDIIHDIVKKRIDHLGNVIGSRQDGVGAPKIERPLQRHGGRLDHNEVYCGSCYGAETSDHDCCNSCEEVREAYQKKGWGLTNLDLIDQCQREGFVQKIKEEEGEGCNINGFVEVSKVAGNFHFAAGKSFHQSNIFLQDLMAAFQTENYNISHKINKLSFGKEFPGIVNPLDGVQWTQHVSSGMYQYFIKVVPTVYIDITGRKIHSNQFSVTEHFRDTNVYPKPIPGVYFIYEFSPIKVIFTEENRSILHFLTNICAIIGGVFTVAGIVDAFVYHGQRAIKKKMELGKYR